MMRLPYISKPRPDEKLSGWLRQIAFEFGLPSAQSLLRAFGLTPVSSLILDFSCPPDLLRRLSTLTGLSMQALEQLGDSQRSDQSNAVGGPKRVRVGYVWGTSHRKISLMLESINLDECERVILRPPKPRKYNNIQRELARAEIFRAEPGTTFVFYDLSTLAYSANDLSDLFERCLSRDIHLEFLKEDILLSNGHNLSLLRIASTIYDNLETDLEKESGEEEDLLIESRRRKQDFRAFRKGRKRALTVQQAQEAAELYLENGTPVAEISQRFGTSQPTIYRVIMDHRLGRAPRDRIAPEEE